MNLWLIKDHEGRFHPLNDTDRDKADKIPTMEENYFTLKRMRNPQHHRKYFAMIKLGFDNQDTYKDQEIFRKVMQMRAGYFDEILTEKGVKLYFPRSISFEKLAQTDFEELYDKVYEQLSKEFNIEDHENFINELNQFA